MTPQALEIQRLMQEYIQEWVTKQDEEEEEDKNDDDKPEDEEVLMGVITEEAVDAHIPPLPSGPRPKNLDSQGNVIAPPTTPKNNESLAEISLLSEAERSQVMDEAKKEVTLDEAEKAAIAEEARELVRKELEAEKERKALLQKEKEQAKAKLRAEVMAQAKEKLLLEAKKEAMAKAKEEMMEKLRAEAMREARRELGLPPVEAENVNPASVKQGAETTEGEEVLEVAKEPKREVEAQQGKSGGGLDTIPNTTEDEGKKETSTKEDISGAIEDADVGDVDEIVDEIAGRISIDDIVNSEFE